MNLCVWRCISFLYSSTLLNDCIAMVMSNLDTLKKNVQLCLNNVSPCDGDLSQGILVVELSNFLSYLLHVLSYCIKILTYTIS